MKRIGFTFVELLVVLAIMAALVCVAAPYATRSNKSQKLKQESLNIATVLNFLIDEAVNTNRATRFTLNSKKTMYILEIATVDNYQHFIPMEGYLGQPHWLGPDINITDVTGFDSDMENDFLIFDPSRPWPTAGLTLVAENETITIRINGPQIETMNYQSVLQD